MADSAPKTLAEPDKRLFWACFIALVATAFGFIVRANVINEWGVAFNLTETQKGEIFGVGLWPFAISIILFSLVIDRIGYGKAMVFAFACHIISAIVTIFATGYWSLYIGTFIAALGNGTVEAVINPVVATAFRENKTKWLNILHAGWPGGLVLAGLLALMLGMGEGVSWQVKVGLIFIPTIAYGIMMLGCKFPVSERVAAGVPYRDMLKELGFVGAAIVLGLIVFEVMRVANDQITAMNVSDMQPWLNFGIIGVITAGYAAWVRSPGRPMLIFLLLIMIPLATTELGTDSWITPLMEPEMRELGLESGMWILVYTSFIMMVLRFCAGPLVHKLSPLGLLALSALLAALGLVALSKSSGLMILAAATLFALGKTFFWPTMLGVVAERFPRGGALTLNAMGGVGMLGVGVIGAVFLGAIQDHAVDDDLLAHDQANNTALHSTYVTQERTSVFGDYKALDPQALESANDADRATIEGVQAESKKSALMTVAIFPVIMLACYIVLIVYFQTKGGYRAIDITEEAAEPPTGEF